jgi:hypothetical protein
MARRERRGGRHREISDGSLEQNILGGILLAVVILLAGAFVYFYSSEKSKRADINPTTFCQKSILPETTVVLVDHTDDINPTQRVAIENRLWDIASSVKMNGAIKLFSVAKITTKVLEPDIDLCNPGTEKDVNEVTGNKAFAKRKFEEKFKKPLNELLSSMMVAPKASQSPIMEALQSIVVTSFVGGKNDAKIKRIVLVSDLLEHTNDFSIYRGIPEFISYKRQPHWPKVKADMSGIEVTIFFLHRAGQEKLQTSALRNFWIEYLEAQGASVERFVPIEG